MALARLARELGARFAVVADPEAYGELKAELAGSNIEPAAGPDAIVEAARRPADWVMAAITGAASLETYTRRRRARRHGCASQQGMPGLRRRAFYASGGRGWSQGASGRFRA